MPDFSIDDLSIGVHEFYDSCSELEKVELIKLLAKDEKIFAYVKETGEIDVREVYDLMDRDEVEELIDILTYEGKLKEHQYIGHVRSVQEMHFQEGVRKLDGNWNRLSQQEEDIIMKIANKF